MQMLFYTIIDSALAAGSLLKGLLIEADNISNFFSSTGDPHIISGILILVAFAVSCLAFYLISMFFKFHVELVLSNRTTIENLERKRNEETGQPTSEVN